MVRRAMHFHVQLVCDVAHRHALDARLRFCLPERFACDALAAEPDLIFDRGLPLLVGGIAGMGFFGAALGIEATPESIETGGMIGFFVAIFLAVIIFYVVLGLIALAFYAKFFREVVGATRWKDLEFSFNASTRDWLVLFLGDIVLVVLTLGIGSIFLSYRHWKFFITHMEASGEILLDELTQSETRMASQGEGLLDAFDIGAV